MRVFSATHTGCVRSQNEDCVYANSQPIGNLENLFIVADGMGGHNAGEYASRTAIDIVTEEVKSSEKKEPVAILRQAITSANHSLYLEASLDADKKGMGTTMVAATISDAHLYVTNVGDSRLYIANDKEMHQITQDHSWVQEMVRRGGMLESEALAHKDRHVITRAVGAEDTIKIDVFDVDLSEGDLILLATDGLTNMVSDDDIHKIITNRKLLAESADYLVDTANRNGGKDNITVIVIEPFDYEVKTC